MVPVVLAILVAAEVASPELRDLTKGCTISPMSKQGVRLSCEEIMASVSDHGNLDLAKAREIQVTVLKLATQSTTSVVPFTAGGKSWEATKLEAVGPDGKVSFQGHVLAASVGGVSRIAFCGALLPKPEVVARCADLLAAFIEQGPGPLAPPPNPAPLFLGEAVTVPSDCQTLGASETGFRIQCGRAAFVTYRRFESADELPEKQAESHQRLVKGGGRAGEDRPCRVAGVSTQCRTVSTSDGPGQIVIYIGAAVVRGTPVLIQCGQLAKQTGMHPVCAPLLGL